MDYTYRIPIGDHHKDGHGQFEYVYVKTNYRRAEIEAAYRKAVAENKLGFGPGDYCSDKYKIGDKVEAYEMSDEQYEYILALNLGDKVNKAAESYKEDAVIEHLVLLILAITSTQMPDDWRYEIELDQPELLLDIGAGYGLFGF